MQLLNYVQVVAIFCCGMLLAVGMPAHAADTAVAAVTAPTADDLALGARAEKVIRAAQGTPGQEAANFMSDTSGWVHQLLLQLQGLRPATADELTKARAQIGSLTATAEQGPGWPIPAVQRIPHTRGHITIDGAVDQHAWRHAASYQTSYPLNEKTAVVAPATCWRVLWDAHYLYFAFEVTDEQILPEPETSKRDIWNGDCVEIFLLPDGKTAKYWELIFNPAGDIYQGLHTKLLHQWGPAPGEQPVKMAGLQWAYRINKTGYTITAAVPIAQLPGFSAVSTAKKGMRLQMVLARFDKSDHNMQYLYNKPVLSWGHNIWSYGTVELVK